MLGTSPISKGAMERLGGDIRPGFHLSPILHFSLTYVRSSKSAVDCSSISIALLVRESATCTVVTLLALTMSLIFRRGIASMDLYKNASKVVCIGRNYA